MSQQQQLPFAEAEGGYAERKALLWVALRQVGASQKLTQFAQWLFDATAGGLGEPVTASYRELASRPWMLNCSLSTVKRAVAEGVRAGIVAAEEVVDQHQRDSGHRFAICHDEVRAIVRRAAGREPVAVQFEPVGGQDEQLGVQIEQLGGQFELVGVQNEQLGVQNEQPEREGEVAASSPAVIPAGETPRACVRAPACAPSFVRSSLNVDVNEGTNEGAPVTWEAIVLLARRAKDILYPNSTSPLRHKDPRHWTIARLSYLALSVYGQEWLVDGLRSAVARKPRDLGYAKGTLANTSGDRAAFFARFDGLRQDADWYQPAVHGKADDG